MEEKTVWERIADALTSHGIDVYPPAIKTGECKNAYVVVKGDGSSQIAGFSSESHYYTVLCYVPKTKYTNLSRYKKQVKDIIAKEVYPMLMPTGQETPDFYDDTVKAYMVSILYRNSVRNTQL